MPSTARVTPDIQVARLQALGTSPAAPLFRYMVTLEAKVETRAKQNLSGRMVNVRTGNLRSSGRAETAVRGATLVGSVIFDAPYALAVHNGQKPHEITPTRPGGVLAWQAPGGMRFARRVRHPGTRGRPFLKDALDVIT